jgi:hypothetical protein
MPIVLHSYFGGDIQIFGSCNSKEDKTKIIDLMLGYKPNALCLEISSYRPATLYGLLLADGLIHLKELFLNNDINEVRKKLESREIVDDEKIGVSSVATVLAKFLNTDLWAVEPYFPLYFPEDDIGKDDYKDQMDFYREVREPLVAINIMKVHGKYPLENCPSTVVITGEAHAKNIHRLIEDYPSWLTEKFMQELEKKIKYYTELELADGVPATEHKVSWEELLELLSR